jgi:hypothetical protein
LDGGCLPWIGSTRNKVSVLLQQTVRA